VARPDRQFLPDPEFRNIGPLRLPFRDRSADNPAKDWTMRNYPPMRNE